MNIETLASNAASTVGITSCLLRVRAALWSDGVPPDSRSLAGRLRRGQAQQILGQLSKEAGQDAETGVGGPYQILPSALRK